MRKTVARKYCLCVWNVLHNLIDLDLIGNSKFNNKTIQMQMNRLRKSGSLRCTAMEAIVEP